MILESIALCFSLLFVVETTTNIVYAVHNIPKLVYTNIGESYMYVMYYN